MQYLSAMLNLPQLPKFLRTFLRALLDVLTVFRTGLRSRSALAAENLFLRKQLALYLERKNRPRRATDAVRFTMALLATFFEWRQADHRQDGYPDPMASKGIPTILEMEVSPRAPSDSPRASIADCQYGSQQSLMGRRTSRL